MSPFDKRHADDILARFPGPVLLAIRRRRKLVSFAVCLGLTMAFAWVVFVSSKDSNEWIGFAIFLVFFGVLTVRGAIMVLMPSIGTVTLDANGFELTLFVRTLPTSWRDVVGDFREDKIRMRRGWLRVVTFEAIVASALRRDPKRAKRVLHDNFELTLDELVWLMNEWRRRALAQTASRGPDSTRNLPKIGRRR